MTKLQNKIISTIKYLLSITPANFRPALPLQTALWCNAMFLPRQNGVKSPITDVITFSYNNLLRNKRYDFILEEMVKLQQIDINRHTTPINRLNIGTLAKMYLEKK